MEIIHESKNMDLIFSQWSQNLYFNVKHNFGTYLFSNRVKYNFDIFGKLIRFAKVFDFYNYSIKFKY